jgi:hypothetical protein
MTTPRASLTVEVRLRERQVLFVAPDNDGTRQWGVYGCPEMHRTADGSIVVFCHGHMDTYDSEAGAKAPAVAFRSRDNGLTWEKDDPARCADSDTAPDLGDGARVQFVPKGPPADLRALGVAPLGMVVSANGYGLLGLYRAADFPLAARTFQVRYQPAGADAPQVADAVIDVPDWQIGATLKAKTGAAAWPDVTPTFAPLGGAYVGYCGLRLRNRERLVEAPDGAWLSAIVHWVATERNSSALQELRCIASTDHGKTWRARGVIVGRAGTRFGATLEFSMIRLGDELVCVDRMDHATTHDPHRYTALARSADNGFTWSAPERVASSSVTPHLVKLENGTVALVFGRPGVHVQFSSDGCRSWEALTSLIGKTAEEEVAAGRDLLDAMYRDTVSYSNTRTVITGPDRFLVLYTDFKYGGEQRKAIVVQEVIVSPRD